MLISSLSTARKTSYFLGLTVAALSGVASAQENPPDGSAPPMAPIAQPQPQPLPPPEAVPMAPPTQPMPVEMQPPPPPPPALATPSSWALTWGGYVHGAYRWIQQPQNYDLAGRNNGFQLEQARILVNVQWRKVLAARVSLEGASEDRLSQSFPGGQLTARLRDAYITWAPLRALRFTVGQTVTPWDLDSMRSDAELPFVSRAVPVEGVQPTEGFTTRGMGADRSLGLSIHSGFIPVGHSSSLRYAVFLGNGNGQNQILNDSNLPAIFGRAEYAFWGQRGLPEDSVRPMFSVTDDLRKPVLNLGLAGQWNPRTAGNLPDLIRETDVGAAADLAMSYFGFEVQAGVLYIKTMHDTLSAVPDLERFGWWAHVRYSIPRLPVEIMPSYRIASYAPRSHLGSAALTPMDAQFDASFNLLYHTVGVYFRPTRTFPLHAAVNYTFTIEQTPNELANDRLEIDAVASF